MRSSELASTLLGAALGLLANTTLVFGALNRRRFAPGSSAVLCLISLLYVVARWFLVHWLVLHFLLLLLLLVAALLLVVLQPTLWQLLGLLLLALLDIAGLVQVWSLFRQLSAPSHLPPLSVPLPAALPPMLEPGWEVDRRQLGALPPATEFYPVDPVSRGLADRLNTYAAFPSQPAEEDRWVGENTGQFRRTEPPRCSSSGSDSTVTI